MRWILCLLFRTPQPESTGWPEGDQHMLSKWSILWDTWSCFHLVFLVLARVTKQMSGWFGFPGQPCRYTLVASLFQTIGRSQRSQPGSGEHLSRGWKPRGCWSRKSIVARIHSWQGWQEHQLTFTDTLSICQYLCHSLPMNLPNLISYLSHP